MHAKMIQSRYDMGTAVTVGLVLGVVATIGMWVVAINRPDVSVTTPPISDNAPILIVGVLFNVVGPVLVVGIPVALLLRYGLLTPLAVLVVGFVLVTQFTSAGELPRPYVALVLLSPVYLVVYLVVGSIEYVVRNGSVPFL